LLRSTSSRRRQNWPFFSWKGVLVWIVELRRDYRLGHAFGFQLLGELLALLVEEVEEPLQDKHAEDDFLVLRGIHIATQVVTGAEQEAGELAQDQLGRRVCLFCRS
jgi:hypothetical protein